jgi:hypothetical protein
MMQLNASPFSPVAMDDEYFLSYLWRWAQLAGGVTFGRSVTSFIGIRPNSISAMLTPSFLAKIVNVLPDYMNIEDFLCEHTNEKYLMTLSANGADEKRFAPISKMPAADFGCKHLRWCEGCAKEGVDSLGLAYWRTSHQDPRLLRCQRHKLQLLATCHLCKRKVTKLKQFGQPPSSANCQYCFAPLKRKFVRDLTPFQYWLEQLHHMGNHGFQVDRAGLITRVRDIVEADKATLRHLPWKNWNTPQKRFINAFNETKACDHFICGEVTYEMLNYYSQLKLDYVLNPNIQQSTVMLALIGWTFLPEDERHSRFGKFLNGSVTQLCA